MKRREFLHFAAAAAPLPLLAVPGDWKELPKYRIVDRAGTDKVNDGLPGLFPGRYVRVHSEKAIDIASNRIDGPTVKSMLSTGMCRLTGASEDRDAWSRFISPPDVVGIKVNCSGAPAINSSPELVSAIIDNLLSIGVQAQNIYIYDRFGNQMRIVNFEAHVPTSVRTAAAENSRGSILGYDPFTYVEVDFFGEDDTRSNLIRLVSDKFTKVINVPTMKEHRAAGVTGCLKNLAYGNFSNVARSHRWAKTNTYSFIGTLASVDTLRSKTVLNVADGLRSLWQGGPFCQSPRFLFYPKEIVVGTDPVAIDHHLIDMVEEKRRQEGAPSLFDRSPEHVRPGPELDPNFNSFIREPGHVEYASTLGLGVFEKSKIDGELISL
jgi:uncharacterized protein (DUF362 family)